jgi:transposase
VTAAELSGWREAFLAAGEASLKSRPADAREAAIGRLKEKVGDLTIERSALDPCPKGPGPRGPGGANELLAAKIERLETARPLAPRRSRR